MMGRLDVAIRMPLLFMVVLSSGGCWNDSSEQTGSSYMITSILLDPNSCAVDATTGLVDCPTVYVATDGGGIFKSLDGGGSWSRIATGLIEWTISVLVMDLGDPQTLYAGTENNGLFKTVDGGATWFNPSPAAAAIKSITSIAVDPRSTCLPFPCVYAGSEESGVWVSEDEGLNWAKINDGLPETIVTALAVFSYSVEPSALYAGTEGGRLYKFNRTNNQNVWEEGLPGLSEKTSASPLVIAVNPITPTYLYVGTSGGEAQSAGGAFRSANGGATWDAVSIPNAQNYSVRVLTFCLQIEPQCPPTVPDSEDPPENDALRAEDVLYAGVFGLSRTSVPEGLWENIISISDVIQTGNNVSSLAMDTLRHTTLYGGTLSGFVIKSQDAGATWKRIDINL